MKIELNGLSQKRWKHFNRRDFYDEEANKISRGLHTMMGNHREPENLRFLGLYNVSPGRWVYIYMGMCMSNPYFLFPILSYLKAISISFLPTSPPISDSIFVRTFFLDGGCWWTGKAVLWVKVGLYESTICVQFLFQVVASSSGVFLREKWISWELTFVVKQLECLAGQRTDCIVWMQPSSSKDGKLLRKFS